MSRRIADLLIKIGADSYEFQQRTQQVERSLQGLQKKITSVGKTLSKTLTLPLVALGTASVMAADTQAQAETRLLTALKGREDIQRRLMAQAVQLQSRSTFGDEEVIAQQAYLASLGMTERQINDVIEASAQLSVATGMTLESAVKNLGKTSASAGQATGLIGQLQTQICTLEESLGNAKTVEEIAATNAEIERLRGELSRLQDIKPEDLKPFEKLEPILAPDFEIEFPAPKFKMDGIKLAVSEYSMQMGEIFSTVREELFGWADNTSTYLANNLSATVEMVENYTAALTNKGWNFTAALEHVSQTVASTMQYFDQQVSQFLADSIVAAADALGEVIAGDLGFGGLMKAILTQFATFLKNIGAQLIEFGIMIIAFKSALKSVLVNPWAAIGIGAAMVAAAAIMTALINKNTQESVPAFATGGLAYGKTLALVGDNPNAIADPEVIAPLSKLQAMLPSGGSQNIKLTLGGQLVAKGRDLVYVLGKENFKTSILGG